MKRPRRGEAHRLSWAAELVRASFECHAFTRGQLDPDFTGPALITDRRNRPERDNGSELWANTQLSYRNLTAPVSFGDYVVVGDGEGYLYWLDDTSGRILAMQELDSDGLYVAPVADGDMLYVQTRSGDLVALKRP